MALRSKPVAQELRHRAHFDVRGADRYGTPGVGEFAAVFSCRAAFRPAGGSEAVIAARLEGRQVLHVYVRSSEQTRKITTDWRMRSTSRGVETVYSIDAVDTFTDRQWVYLQVESGVAA